jgi:ketosteroid isomerase-like protein
VDKRWVAIAGGVVAIGLAVWLLFFRGGSDEDAVREAIRRTVAAARVVPGESPVVRGARVRGEFLDTIAADVSINIPELTDVTRGRDALTAAAVAGAQAWERAEISISFGKVQIDQGTAFVDATANLDATRHGGTPDRDTRRCSFRLEKRDGKWRIFELTVYPKEGS